MSRGRPGTRPSGRRWLLAVPPLVVLVELLGILLVGQALGAGWTLLLLLAGALLGGVLLVRGGVGGARRAVEHARQRGSAEGTGRELADAGLQALGALLLVLPGYVSDVVGLLCVLPFTRPLVRRLLGAAASATAYRVVGVRRGDVVAGRVVLRPDAGGPAGGRAGPVTGRVLPPGPDDGRPRPGD